MCKHIVMELSTLLQFFALFASILATVHCASTENLLNLYPKRIPGSAAEKEKNQTIFYDLSQSSHNDFASASEDHCNLACWLKKLRIELPPVSFTKLGTTVTISNLICGQTVIQHIQSNLPKKNEIFASFQEIEIECSANWKATNIIDTFCKILIQLEDCCPSILNFSTEYLYSKLSDLF